MDAETIIKSDVIILGAGAAGLFCGIEAGKRGRKVIILEHNSRPGKKILISGGGRCNFTNLGASPAHYLSDNPSFCISALKRYPPQTFIQQMEKWGISYHEKKLGQLFCDRSSDDLLECLLHEVRQYGVEILTEVHPTRVVKEDNLYITKTDKGVFHAPSLVLATGGLSLPKSGASDLGYRIATEMGHTLIPPRPALVPLLWGAEDSTRFDGMAGVSLEVKAQVGKTIFRENLLFTHKGLSGPAILQISSYWKEGEPVWINFCPEYPMGDWLIEQKQRKPSQELKTLLNQLLPERLARRWCEVYHSSKPLCDCKDKQLRFLGETLNRWMFIPAGTEGFVRSEVTRGGLNTREFSSKTMESQCSRGLYVIGEILDVTGWLGGYNFQWAWSSGWAAGNAL